MKNITNNSVEILSVLNQISDVIGLYVITVIAAIGIVTNYCFLTILSNKRLKHKFYQNLWMKAFSDLVVCLIGVCYLNDNTYTRIENGPYWTLFIHLYMSKLSLRIALQASTYAEIYLILNRCIILFKPKSNLLYFNKWIVLFCNYCFFISINIPMFAVVEIRETDVRGVFTIYQKFIGPKHKLYVAFWLFLQVFPVIALLFLNVLSIIKFRQKMSQLKTMGNTNTSANDKFERRTTKTIIILSCLFLICKSLDLWNLIFLIYENETGENFLNKSVLNFIRQMTFLLNFTFHVFNSFIYFHTDSYLRRTIDFKLAL